MKKAILGSFALLILATSGLQAQDPEAPRRRGRQGFGGPRGDMGAPLMVSLADANRDGSVTTGEWTGFTQSLPSDEEGRVDSKAVRNLMLGRFLDLDADGQVKASDLFAIFASFDTDESGVITGDELRGGRFRRGGAEGRGRNTREANQSAPPQDAPRPGGTDRFARMVHMSLVRAADADQSRDVTTDEWKALVARLEGEGGSISLDKVAEATAGDGRRSPLERMTQDLTTEKLQGYFTRLDRNQDGTVDSEELSPGRRGRGPAPEAPPKPEEKKEKPKKKSEEI